VARSRLAMAGSLSAAARREPERAVRFYAADDEG
jgi:hypothetical protein